MPARTIEGLDWRTGDRISLSLEGGKIADAKREKGKAKDFPWVAPGLVDLQINGYAGVDFNSGPLAAADLERTVRELARDGVTSFFPTLVTNSGEAIEEELRGIAKACAGSAAVGAAVAGIHLEGPFISPEDGPRGAHNKEHVRAPDWDLFQRWQKAAEGRIRIITLSPEWRDAHEFIRRCTGSGVTVSVGHTAATPEQIQDAVRAGARLSTHLGNGTHLTLHRHANYVWEQLATDELWSSAIADGFHLPDSVLKVILRVKGPRVVLVSDATSLAGQPPGSYRTPIGEKVVLTPEGRLYLEENPALLAGSVKLLRSGIEHLLRGNLCSFGQAWEMASVRPSQFLGLPTAKGLGVGAPADVVILRREETAIRIEEAYKAGELVFDSAKK